MIENDQALVQFFRNGGECADDGNECKMRDARSGCTCTIAADTITRLTARVAELEVALEFYGKPENWESVWDHQFKMMVQEPAYRDKGDKARTALNPAPKETSHD